MDEEQIKNVIIQQHMHIITSNRKEMEEIGAAKGLASRDAGSSRGNINVGCIPNDCDGHAVSDDGSDGQLDEMGEENAQTERNHRNEGNVGGQSVRMMRIRKSLDARRQRR